jgi:hypothetical protein
MLFGILYNLFSILQLAGTVLIVKVFGEKYFPESTNRIQEYILWNGLKCYTIVQGKCRDCIKKGKLFLTNYFDINNSKDYVQFIQNGNVIQYYNAKYVGTYTDYPKCEFILQFLKVEQFYNNKFEYNVIRFNNISDFLEYNTTNTNKTIYTPSPAKFLGMKLIISNESNAIEINIHSGCNNFCMNSNIVFDRPFLQFYLNQYHDISLNDTDTYELTFIDHKIDTAVITEEHYIELNEDGYKIRFIRT